MEAAIRAQGVLNDVELAAGTVLAGYQLVRVVSRTRGVHLVYEAVDPAGQRVAMKLVSRGLGQNRRFRDRFEPLLAKRSAIEHPHLLPILDRGEFVDADVPGTTCLYVVSEFVDSPTLSELLDERPPDADAALRLLGQVADGLDAAHAHGLVHPHLTPSDILVEERTGGGHALLTDFLGESAQGEDLTPSRDVYSLTLILAECLTGERPVGPVRSAVPADSAPQGAQVNGLPDGLEQVVATGMARNSAEQYSTCTELVKAAAEALDGIEPGALRPLRVPAGSPRRTPAAAAETPAQPLTRERQQDRPAESRRLPTARFALSALAIGAVLGAGVGAIAAADDEASPEPSRSQPAERGAASERAALVRRATPPVDRLLAARAAGRRRLARARRQAGQATAAAAIGRAYAVAARQLEAAGAEDLAVTARRGASAYDRLAAAARSGERGRWRATSRSVRRVDTALARELLEFGGRAAG